MSNQVKTDIQLEKLFQSLDVSKADFTGIQGKIITLNQNDVLYCEGEEADSIYLIIHGEIKLINNSLIGDEGLVTAGNNEFIGYSEFIESSVRVSTAIANCDTFLFKMSNGEIDELIDRNQSLLQDSRHGFSNQEDELWEQWDLLLNGYIFNSPPSVDVVPDKHKHSVNNNGNGNKPEINPNKGNFENHKDEHTSEKSEELLNDHSETSNAGLITQQEIDNTFDGKVKEDISVDSFGMIDEDQLLGSDEDIETSPDPQNESNRKDLNSKWHSLFEDSKINPSSESESQLNSQNNESAEEFDYPTIDEIISQYSDETEDSHEDIVSHSDNGTDNISETDDEIILPIDDLDDDLTEFYSPTDHHDLEEKQTADENLTENKIAELEALFEPETIESEPIIESSFPDTPAAETSGDVEIESSWNQLENLVSSAKDDNNITDTVESEIESNLENPEPIDLQIVESHEPNPEQADNIEEDSSGFIIEEFKDEESFDLTDEGLNSDEIDITDNTDSLIDSKTTEVINDEDIEDIDIIEDPEYFISEEINDDEDDEQFIPEEQDDINSTELDIFEIESEESFDLEENSIIFEDDQDKEKDESVIDISNELREFEITEPSESVDLSELEETGPAEWDNPDKTNEQITENLQSESSSPDSFELNDIVSESPPDHDIKPEQLQTVDIDKLEIKEEIIDFIEENQNEEELKEVYEEDGVCITISGEGEDTQGGGSEAYIKNNEVENRKVEILKKKEEEREVLENMLSSTKNNVSPKEWDIVDYSVEQNTDLKFQENIFEDIMVITINLERCTLQFASEFRNYMLSLMKGNFKKIIVDMSNCNFMDSSFLGALVASLKKFKTLKGDLRLVWDDPNHSTMLFLTGMDKIFNIYDNIKEAIYKFSDDIKK